jgi:hypothetical protein
MPRFRPRISLLSALLLMTIVAMAIVVVGLWREVGPLRAENKQLNEERGTLVIGEPAKLHAIKIPARFAGEGRHSFRIYVPPGQTYMAFAKVNDVPKDGLPEPKKLPNHAGILGLFQDRLFGRIGPGEHIVTIRTIRHGTKADIYLIIDGLDAGANTSRDRWPTNVPETYHVFGGGVGGTAVVLDRREPLVLLRRRIMAAAQSNVLVSYSMPEPDLPLDGVLLWVERAPQ